MTNRPEVSVIMNCFNGEKYLSHAIDSVLAQTYHNWEIIFWDNQSTDKSAKIFQSYNDPRLRYFYSSKHILLYSARNNAIEKASGEFYAFLDVDDWWEPKKLEKQISLFNDPEVGLVYGNFFWMNEIINTKKIGLTVTLPSGWIFEKLVETYVIGMLTMVVRKIAYESLDTPFNPNFSLIGDLDLAIRISVSWKIDCIQEPVAFCRWHGNNLQITSANRKVFELTYWQKYMNEHPVYGKILDTDFYEINITKAKIIQYILDGFRFKAMLHVHNLKSVKDKIKMLIACLMPLSIILNRKK
jgi:glycosyltransferase involved in cell wall biosynthesis